MKKVVVVTVFLALAGSLYGQSVAELSKREKARRAGLGANRAKVVTNADLAAVRKTPAITVSNPESSAEATPAGAGGENPAGVVDQGSGDATGSVVMVPTVAKDGPALFKDGQTGTVADAEARLKATNELIDLLTTKMNALLQESNNLNTMTPKDVLQRQIDETNQKLIRVQDEAAKLKAQIEAAKK